MLNIAENLKSYFYLAETHLLQAKLSLLTLDIKKAKQFLTQAQNVAESCGMKRLAMNISNEHDTLLKHTKLWKKDTEIPFSDRLEIANLKEQMEIMTKNRAIELPELQDEESILLLILSEGGITVYSHPFRKQIFENHLFGGFLTSINAFVNEIFSEGLNRASFGEHTLIMESISPFLICYIYKGASYYAIQRVKSFIEKIQNNKEMWQILENYYQSNRIIQKEDIPSLNMMVNKIFIEKSIPSE